MNRYALELSKTSLKVNALVSEQGSFNASDLIFPELGDFHGRIDRAIERSGEERWQKKFINLRSSCTTDLESQGLSEKTLDCIFGNSVAIRKKHYVQFLKDKNFSLTSSGQSIARKIFFSLAFTIFNQDTLHF
jgi:hypothetical protein